MAKLADRWSPKTVASLERTVWNQLDKKETEKRLRLGRRALRGLNQVLNPLEARYVKLCQYRQRLHWFLSKGALHLEGLSGASPDDS